MNTIHQAKIEGYGSLNFSRQRGGGIDVNLTAPDGGPKHNTNLNFVGKLKDEKPIATIEPEGIDDLIDYLMQFSTRSIGRTLYPMKEVADHEA